MDHWRRGHKQMCKKIHRGGNAEQYHADKKYKEAVAVAVEACAADTWGQSLTCYICLEGEAEEGLVRGCSCRGGSGIAHVSCLARQAQVAVRTRSRCASSAARIRSKRRSSMPCDTREPSSAPAKRRRRNLVH